LNSQDYVTIDNITLKYPQWDLILVDGTSDNVILQNFTGTYAYRDGIRFEPSASNNTINNVDISYCGDSVNTETGAGINFANGAGVDDNIIQGSTLHNIYGDGISVHGDGSDGPDRTIARYNTTHTNSRDGIDFNQTTDSIIEYNLTYGNCTGTADRAGIAINGDATKQGSGNIVRYNLSRDNTANSCTAIRVY
jgi:hypothetical protein